MPENKIKPIRKATIKYHGPKYIMPYEVNFTEIRQLGFTTFNDFYRTEKEAKEKAKKWIDKGVYDWLQSK